MDVSVGEKLDFLVRTRDEDFKELSMKINQVNKQLNVRMDFLIERFEEMTSETRVSRRSLFWKNKNKTNSNTRYVPLFMYSV
jgi:hypothetical protein